MRLDHHKLRSLYTPRERSNTHMSHVTTN